MTEQAQRDPTRQSGENPIAEPLVQMIQGFGESVREQVEQLRAEASERAAGGAKGAGLLVAAGATGTISLAALATLPLMALRRLLPGWGIAVLVAAGGGAATAVLAQRGLQELAAAAPVDAERIKDAARDPVRNAT